MTYNVVLCTVRTLKSSNNIVFLELGHLTDSDCYYKTAIGLHVVH